MIVYTLSSIKCCPLTQTCELQKKKKDTRMAQQGAYSKLIEISGRLSMGFSGLWIKPQKDIWHRLKNCEESRQILFRKDLFCFSRKERGSVPYPLLFVRALEHLAEWKWRLARNRSKKCCSHLSKIPRSCEIFGGSQYLLFMLERPTGFIMYDK